MASEPSPSLDYDKSKHYCGCDQSNLHLHVEIENLKQRLLEREKHIVKMETNFLREAEKFPNGELAALTEELLTWQDKYSRLFEAHKRVQRVNQGLEDKLLKMVDRCETEKNNLQEDISILTEKLLDQETLISKLHEENMRCRNDLNIAIQLLQCKPSNFIPQKFDVLPPEIQAKVRAYVVGKQKKFTDDVSGEQKSDVKTIKVPIPTFPPTAMVYSLGTETESRSNVENSCSSIRSYNSGDGYSDNISMTDRRNRNLPVDIVSAAIMAKILREREKERSYEKHCQSCSCAIILYDNKSCQTDDNFTIDRTNVENNNGDGFNNNVNLTHESTTKSLHNWNTNSVLQNTPIAKKANNDSKIVVQDLVDLNSHNSDYSYQTFETRQNNAFANVPTEIHCETDDNSGRDSSSCDMTHNTSCSENVRGPRLCSVRLQPGSNNILLDNAAHFSSPVLYRRRANVNDISESEPTVHLGKIRVSSVSSNYEGSKMSTETEI